MEHCASCGRLVLFVGKLNKRNECQECESERIENESEDNESEEQDAHSYIRKAGINPYQRYIFS